MSERVEIRPEKSAKQDVLTEFILSLVQAFLRTGYYLPEHPQSKMAKHGLYSRFKSLFRGRHELTFMLQETGEIKNILVDGALPETQKLNRLMTRGMAEVYVPRLAKFLERKDLISLTLKERMEETEFSRFIDVMSEPTFMTLDEAGKSLFTDRLRQNDITHISYVFNEDLIDSGRKLPWRVQLSISRLRKDLRCIPMFQDLDAEGFRALRKQIIEDVLRPISKPEILAALLLNSDLARTAEVDGEGIEDEIVAAIAPARLADTGHAAMRTHFSSAEGSPPEQRQRALIKLFGRLRTSEAPGAEEVMREYLRRRLIEFDALPRALQRQITVERETDGYLKDTARMIQMLDDAPSAETYRHHGEKLLRITAELLRRGSFDGTLALVETFRRHTSLTGFRAPIAAGFFQEIAAGDVGNGLQERFLQGKKEERITLGSIFRILGTYGQMHLLGIVRKTSDTWVRKNACELLLKSGPEGEGLLLGVLAGGKLAPTALPEILTVLGESGRASAKTVRVLKMHLESKNPKVREEAVWSLCRIRGKAEAESYLRLLDDPDIDVRKRAVRCLRSIRSLEAIPPMMRILRQAEQDPALDPLAIQIYQTLADFPGIELEPGIDAERYLVGLLKQAYPRGLRAVLRMGGQRQLSDAALRAICETLGAIGTGPSREVLADLARRAMEDARRILEQTIASIDQRLRNQAFEEEEGEDTAPVEVQKPGS